MSNILLGGPALRVSSVCPGLAPLAPSARQIVNSFTIGRFPKAITAYRIGMKGGPSMKRTPPRVNSPQVGSGVGTRSARPQSDRLSPRLAAGFLRDDDRLESRSHSEGILTPASFGLGGNARRRLNAVARRFADQGGDRDRGQWHLDAWPGRIVGCWYRSSTRGGSNAIRHYLSAFPVRAFGGQILPADPRAR